MSDISGEIHDRWPNLYRFGNLSLSGMVLFLFAIKGKALYSISEVCLLIAVLISIYRLRKRTPIPKRNVLVAFVVFALGVLLSSLYQGEWKNIAVSLDYVYIMLNFFVMYIGVRCFCRDEILYKAITIGASVCAVMFLLALSDPNSMKDGRFFAWNNPNVTVQQLAMLIPFLLVAYHALKAQILWRLINVFSLMVILLAVWMTGSRGGILGLVVGIVIVCILYWPVFKSSWSYNKKIMVSIAVLSVISCLALAITMAAFSRSSSDKGRVHRMQIAYQIFLDSPVFGVGSENFNKEYQWRIKSIKDAGENTKNDKHTHSHNDLIHFLATTGILGTSGYIIFSFMIWCCLMKNVIRNKEMGIIWAMMVVMISLYVHGLVDLCILQRNIAKMFFAILGIALGMLDTRCELCEKAND